MDVIIDNLPRYLSGFGMTLQLLVVAGIAALILGTIIATMRISPVPSLRVFGAVYTELIRNTPLTLVLFFCALILPYLGARLDYEVFAMIGLSVYTSPFVAEALRSGINGVPIGQAEAARSLGLGFGQTVGYVVFPQAFRMVIPPLINVIIALTKNTSVAGGFFVVELFTIGKELANANGNAVVAVLLGVATFYLLITIPLGIFAGRLEKKWVVAR
ncbi:glutamate transport system permease protein [Okibacterium sp. HSC-33S16]|uniref:amino acid ABC transporter permease n=1 Tax=Okibacterium sp. HSC-33S16 TaxID=2910965 RepID=UPI0020A013FC|nr:amino acid ABC transporter permease [Okibacterium sp. HSC-33S16]MCP2031965.1 glutamate transport system permease protein [Okibacterium sp. HSC-33S16]